MCIVSYFLEHLSRVFRKVFMIAPRGWFANKVDVVVASQAIKTLLYWRIMRISDYEA
jgi:hypothetical protein